MKNINEYKRRFNILMESTMGDVRPLLNESSCGSGDNIEPITGSNIEIIYGDDTDILKINGEEVWSGSLIKNKTKTETKTLSDGEYEAWGNRLGAALVTGGRFVGYSINPACTINTLPGSTRCPGSKYGVNKIIIKKGHWYFDGENKDTNDCSGYNDMKPERELIYKY